MPHPPDGVDLGVCPQCACCCAAASRGNRARPCRWRPSQTPSFCTDPSPHRRLPSVSPHPVWVTPPSFPYVGSKPFIRLDSSFPATTAPLVLEQMAACSAPPNGFGIVQGRSSAFPISALGLGSASPRDSDVPAATVESWGPAGAVMGSILCGARCFTDARGEPASGRQLHGLCGRARALGEVIYRDSEPWPEGEGPKHVWVCRL